MNGPQVPDDKRVHIFDTTLRDGEQSPGHLAEHPREGRDRPAARTTGRRRDRGGLPDHLARRLRGRRGDLARRRGPRDLRPRAHPQGRHRRCAGARSRTRQRPRIHTFISTSDIHIEHQLQTTREDVKGQARAAVALAQVLLRGRRSSRRWTRPVPTSSSRPRSARSPSRRARRSINIPDTVGYTTPEEYARYFARLYELVPGLRERARSRSTATTTWAWRSPTRTPGVLAGARQVECAVNGIGERAGNCSLEEIVMLLRTRSDVHGLDTGVDTRELARTSRMVSRFTGYAGASRTRRSSGRNAFAHESGIHQDGVLKERTTYEIMDATRGRPRVELDRARQALRPPRAARRARAAGLQGRGQRAEPGVRALQGDRRQEEAGHGARPRGDRLRRDARARRAYDLGLVRGRGRLATRAARAGRGHAALRRGGRSASPPATARSTRSSAPSSRRDRHRVRAPPVHGVGRDRGRGRAR